MTHDNYFVKRAFFKIEIRTHRQSEFQKEIRQKGQLKYFLQNFSHNSF